MHVKRRGLRHLLVTVDDPDELIDQPAGSTLRIPIKGIDHPETATTVDAQIVYVHDRDLFVAAWFYDGIVRRRENRDGDPKTEYFVPGDEEYNETDLAPPEATTLWTPPIPWLRQGGARPHDAE